MDEITINRIAAGEVIQRPAGLEMSRIRSKCSVLLVVLEAHACVSLDKFLSPPGEPDNALSRLLPETTQWMLEILMTTKGVMSSMLTVPL